MHKLGLLNTNTQVQYCKQGSSKLANGNIDNLITCQWDGWVELEHAGNTVTNGVHFACMCNGVDTDRNGVLMGDRH